MGHGTILLATLCLAALWCASQGAPPHEKHSTTAKLPRLFDFANYKKLFRKTYSSLSEELLRAKLFLSRAMRAALSALKYKAGRSSHYLAVNQLSDFTRQEREQMRNKQLGELLAGGSPKRWASEIGAKHNETGRPRAYRPEADLPEFIVRDARPETVQAELERLKDTPGARDLGQLEAPSGRARRKRETSEASRRRRRELSLDQLVRAPPTRAEELAQLGPETAAKVRSRVPSNNPNYEPLEPITQGLRDQQEPVQFIEISPTATFDSFLQEVDEEVEDPMDIDGGGDPAGTNSDSENFSQGELEDAVFTDLRFTNCFLAPRFQGACGSCYAFSMIAIAEFLHCIKTGQLVAFSEQYMIDCGATFQEGLNGCGGAGPQACGQFIHNFGVELRATYPYAERELMCPYEEQVDLKTTGYIRTEIGNAVAISEQLWPEYLKHGPMWVGIVTSGDDFDEYAGGVHRPDCSPERGGHHAMVLIGHGREDGHEYWLFRNSYGLSWGELGHYKLARGAPCVVTPGFMFGTENGRQFRMVLERNAANEQSPQVKQRYVGAMTGSVLG